MSYNTIDVEEEVNVQQRVSTRPQFNFGVYPKGTHARTYSGRVVRLISKTPVLSKTHVNNASSIGWAFGRQGKRIAIKTDNTGKAETRDDSINPDTVKFNRMKTTDIDLTGVPIGTVFKCQGRYGSSSEYYKVVATDDTKEEDKPIKCIRLNASNDFGRSTSEEMDNHFINFTKQGFAYGSSYKQQRNHGDLYYEHVTYPLSDEDSEIQNAHITAKKERRAKARSIFGS